MRIATALLAMLLVINVIACALDEVSQIGAAAQAVEYGVPAVVPWDPETCGPSDIWPAGRGIATTAVTIMPDPVSRDGSIVLADVRWNGGPSGAIYEVRKGTDEAAFRKAVAAAGAALTVIAGDHGGVKTDTGSASAGPVNPPHPNV
jgi:hypothetical protein